MEPAQRRAARREDSARRLPGGRGQQVDHQQVAQVRGTIELDGEEIQTNHHPTSQVAAPDSAATVQ